MDQTSFFSVRNSTNNTLRRLKRWFRPAIEGLEDRITPASLTTFVNDNWVLVEDTDNSGDLSIGDMVDSRLDNGAVITAAYGVDGFGTVASSATAAVTLNGPASLENADSINEAIANTLDNGTLRILAGTYTEAVVVNKTLNLLGAQAGIAAPTRDGLNETILNNPSGSVLLQADNIVLDGFTITGQNTDTGFNAAIATSSAVSGYQIHNNIVRDNALGLYLAGTATGVNPTLIENNLFEDNNATFDDAPALTLSGIGIYVQGLSDAAFRNNTFTGDQPVGAIVMVDVSPTTTFSNITDAAITGNHFLQGNFISLTGVKDTTISGNTFSGLSVRDATLGNDPAIGLHGGNTRVNVIGNLFLDRGFSAIAADLSASAPSATAPNASLTIADNVIRQDVSLLDAAGDLALIHLASLANVSQVSGNAISLTGSVSGGISVHGIQVGTLTGSAVIGTLALVHNTISVEGNVGAGANLRIEGSVPVSAKLYIANNTFLGGAYGVDVARDGTALLPDLDINFNNFLGHTLQGIRLSANNAGIHLDAAQNFWGTASGPGAGATTVNGVGTIVTAPFATTSQLAYAANFSGANGSGLGDSFISAAGSYTLQNNAAVGSAGVNLALVDGALLVDGAVQADLTLASNGNWGGLVARHSGPGDSTMHFGALANVNGELQAFIYAGVNGAFTLLASAVLADLDAAATHTLRFEVFGSALRLHVDGQLAASANDASITGAGRMGLRTGAQTVIDNFLTSLLPFQDASPFSTGFTFGTTLNPADWTAQVGTFSVQNQALVGIEGSNLSTVAGISADVSVAADLTLASDGNWGGLVTRYSGPGDSNLYFGALANVGGELQAFIWKSVNGAWTLLDSTPLPSLDAAATHALRFDAVGSALRLFVDGNLVLNQLDTSLSAGLSGVRAGAGSVIDNLSITPQIVRLPSLTFNETFKANSGNGNQLDASWNLRGGGFDLAARNALGIGGVNLATLNGSLLADGVAQSDVTLSSDGNWGGLVLRHQGPGDTNMYFAALANVNGELQAFIFVNVDGAWNALGSTTVDVVNASSRHTLRFEAVGSSLTLFVDSTQVLSVTDTTFQSGFAGIRTGAGSVLDNLTISDDVPAPAASQEDGLITLQLKPIDLNLLGLQVQTSPITATVTPIGGEGKLLGNLLQTVSGLIDLDQVNQALNNVLGATIDLLNSVGLAVSGVGDGAFSDAPVSSTSILDLMIAPVHLDLLGAQVETSPIRLSLTAHSGPGLVLGNVLTALSDLFNPPLPDSLDLAFINTQLSNLLDALNDQIPGISPAEVPPPPIGEGQIASLTVPAIDVNLLGLVIQTEPITVNAAAETGDGRLLGNVLTSLLNTLDATPEERSELSGNINNLLAKVVGVLNASSLILGDNPLAGFSQAIQTLGLPDLFASSSTENTPILDLVIAADNNTPVDVDLLGLVVTTSNIEAHISAQTGEGLVLGNLLSNVANLLNPGTNGSLLALLNDLATGGNTANVTPGQTTGDTTTLPATELLTIELPALDINLLGLQVQSNPITVTISAQDGQGKLLGNLLTGVSTLVNTQGVSDALNNVLATVVDLVNSVDLQVAGVGNETFTGTVQSTSVLELFVAPVRLDLLGVLVETSEIRLTITAHSGEGNLLGNIVNELADLFNPPLGEVNLQTINDALGQLLTRLNALAPNIGAAEVPPPVLEGDQILSLTVPAIDLNLLGLILQTTPITVNAEAQTGDGALLGNLLTSLLDTLGATPEELSELSGNLNNLLAKVVGILNAATLTLSENPLVESVLQTLSLPDLIATEAGATTQILDLVIASNDANTPPVNVDLLGLVVTTSNINAQLLAQTGEGQVLGNLLYNVANLLNPNGAGALLSLLTQLARL